MERTRDMWRDLGRWPARRWLVVAGVAALTAVIVGVPTVLIPNPWFGRDVPISWWAWPALAITALLAGLVTATYVRSPTQPRRGDRPGRLGVFGGVLSFFAVGCPVCNKVVLLTLGTSGAMQFFQPLQPILALLSIGMLGWALVSRMSSENSCAISVDATP